jgi:phosphoadenosine phosphosulfate reductase
MLINSPRITDRDHAHWERLSHYDDVLSQDPRLTTMANTARQVIRDFAEAGPCYASTSWGKDSTVLADLVATSGVNIPLVWVRVEKFENPDCPAVRDAFLSKHPHMEALYEEIEVEATAPRWWEDGADDAPTSQRTSRGGFTIAEKRHGNRHISGVRAEESRVRRIAQGRWGDAGPYAARPIGRWDATHIFAYLAKHDLPVHPAYAQTMGGHYDRRWLRVSSLGGLRGADRGRAEWEALYYPDIVGVTP